jgi:transcriptional regulator with XRE-family HTH domain
MSPKGAAVVFGSVLKRLRGARGLSQERLATDSGLDRTFISLLERGHRQPSLGTLEHISHALDMTLVDLISEVENEAGRIHSRQGH